MFVRKSLFVVYVAYELLSLLLATIVFVRFAMIELMASHPYYKHILITR